MCGLVPKSQLSLDTYQKSLAIERDSVHDILYTLSLSPGNSTEGSGMYPDERHTPCMTLEMLHIRAPMPTANKSEIFIYLSELY